MSESKKIVIASEYANPLEGLFEMEREFKGNPLSASVPSEPSEIRVNKEKLVLDRTPKPVIRYKTANNLDENGQIFYRPVTERSGTCTVILYLTRKYGEIKGKTPIAKDLLPFITELVRAEQADETKGYTLFSRSQNPTGRVSRTLAENAKLERLGGTYRSTRKYGEDSFPYTEIIDRIFEQPEQIGPKNLTVKEVE